MSGRLSPEIIDISQPVDADAGVFEGDTPFSFEWKWDQAKGSSCNVAAVQLSPHVGTHADAPLHFSAGGASIGEVPLGAYLGPCRVVDLSDAFEGHGGLVRVEHLEGVELSRTPRVLLRTHGSESTRFPEAFVSMSEEAALWLGENGARLVGLDTPSMDPATSTALAAHRALGRAGVAILENLVLAHVEAGEYELIALPLRWMGLDAAPLRAVLRRTEAGG